jgi:hypothetical protein
MGFFATILTTPARLTGFTRGNGIHISKKIVDSAHAEVDIIVEQLGTTLNSLTSEEVETRLETYRPNEVAKEKRQS